MFAPADGSQRRPFVFHGRDHVVRARAVDICARRADRGSPRTGLHDRSGRPGGHRGSSLAAGRSGRRALAGCELGQQSCETGCPFDMVAAHRPGCVADRSELARPLSRPAPDDHPVHDPGSVLPVPTWRIAGAGGTAGASRPYRRARRRLCRRGHAGLARLGEQHAGRRAVRRVRMLDRIRPRRRPARGPVGGNYRSARARSISRLRSRRCIGPTPCGGGCCRVGAFLVGAGMSRPGLRRQNCAPHDRAQRD